MRALHENGADICLIGRKSLSPSLSLAATTSTSKRILSNDDLAQETDSSPPFLLLITKFHAC